MTYASSLAGSNSGGLTKLGAGALSFNAVNSYSGPTTIAQGTLSLGAANGIATTSQVLLSGGTLATNGLNQDFTSAGGATLGLLANSLLDLGAATAATSIRFSNSNTNVWSGQLTVNGWTYGTDHWFVGSDSSSLSGTMANNQLSDIKFADFAKGASISAIGEVTPQIGDINQDSNLGIADLQALLAALCDETTYQSMHSFSNEDLAFILDVNQDGNIDNADIQAEINLLVNRPAPSAAGSLAAVPEPASFLLLTIGLLIWPVRAYGANKQNKSTQQSVTARSN